MEHMRVVKVIDGDTFWGIDNQGRYRKIRPQNLHAPELHQPGGYEAKRRLEGLILNQIVNVEFVVYGPHEREISRVWLGDRRIG